MPLHQISVIPRDVTSSRGCGSTGKAKDKDRDKQVSHKCTFRYIVVYLRSRMVSVSGGIEASTGHLFFLLLVLVLGFVFRCWLKFVGFVVSYFLWLHTSLF